MNNIKLLVCYTSVRSVMQITKISCDITLHKQQHVDKSRNTQKHNICFDNT